jgi:hypothetical protein
MSGLFEQYDNLLPAEIQEKTSESLDWFRKNLRKITLREDQVSRSQGETASPSNMRTGEMFMYMYDAKYKDLLPWYDRFPLMILLEKSPKGFLGLNLHYIAPRYRAVLLEELYKYSTDEDLEEGARFKLTYELLKSVSKLKYGIPCVKRYLWPHIDSRIQRVLPEHWDVVSMLPLQRFNTNANTVYADSRRKFG